MLEISLFVDESGESGTESKYYLLTVVFHEQNDSIDKQIKLYEQALQTKNLPDIPLHASPLMNGNDAYKGMDIQERKKLLQTFFTMLQHLPVKYHTFSYCKSEFFDDSQLINRMKRDLINLLFEHLDYLQSFDQIKVYYDDGQSVVTKALHDAIEYAISANAVMYKDNALPINYRLAQAADLLCTLELTAIKYATGEQTKTDTRFFGDYGPFKKNYLKKIRRKLI